MSQDQKKRYRLAVIPGDGIGKEVMPEGVRVLEAAARKFGIDLAARPLRLRVLRLLREARQHDAGRLEGPDRRPRRHLLRRRRLAGEDAGPRLALGLAAPVPARVRPVRQPAAGAPDAGRAVRRSPAASRATSTSSSCARTPRASTPRIGGRMFPGTDARDRHPGDGDVAHRRRPRPASSPSSWPQARPKKHLTSATKSNGISITMPYWDERVEEMAKALPGRRSWDKFHIDILTAHFVQHPDWFDVVVAINLFGDILSDLGPACTGTIGIAPSANINPERRVPVAVRAGARLGAGHRRARASPTRSARSGPAR